MIYDIVFINLLVVFADAKIFSKVSSKSYIIPDVKVTFDEALLVCPDFNATILTIASEAENHEVNEVIYMMVNIHYILL